jgi:adenylosuccinate lyase
MEARNIFQNISPVDHRYSISEKEVFKALVPWLSEEASVAACIKAEIALIYAHLTVRGQMTPSVKTILEKITVEPAEVYAEEEKTHHFIKALVNILKSKVPKEIAPLVHLGATSADILDTSLSLRIAGVTREVVIPFLKKLELQLCDITEREAETPQVGRTHGQHAVPITLGFFFAEYTARLGKSILEIEKRSKELKGKLSGAVGAYNATSIIVKDPLELERIYLDELNLEPSEYSTQLVEPEHLLRLLLEFNVAFGIIANLADDLRNLQRSEIGEVMEGFSADQVGSSTMPQKRNPWNSEHVKSLWKTFMPRVNTFFMDQISEHQRDLSNSASQRFIADYITGFCLAVSRMTKVIKSLKADKERLLVNLQENNILAEPVYILLAETGESDAHEVIRKITLTAEKEKISFAAALAKEPQILSKIGGKLAELGIVDSPDKTLSFFENPQHYSGLASKKAKDIAIKYRTLMGGNDVH